jgi:hypothetical protein
MMQSDESFAGVASRAWAAKVRPFRTTIRRLISNSENAESRAANDLP